MAKLATKSLQDHVVEHPYTATTVCGLLMFFGLLTIHSKLSDAIIPGIPRLKGDPFLGIAPLWFSEGMMSFLQRLTTLGDDGIAYTVIANKTLVSVHDPAMAKEMFSYPDDVASKLGDVRYFGWSPFWTLIRMIGYNQFDDVGPVAIRRRGYFLKEFQHSKANVGKFDGLKKVARKHVDAIAAKQNGHIGDIRLVVDKYSAALFGDVLYGRDDPDTDDRVINVADEILRRMGSSWSAVKYMLLLLCGRLKTGDPTPGEAKVRQEVEDLYKTNFGHLEEYERKNPDGPLRSIRNLSMYDGGHQTGPLTNFAIEFSRLNIFGGHHSIGSNSCWLLIELGKHPEYLKKLLVEIDGIDEDNYEEVDTKMPYLDACLLEINRLYPSVPATLRVMEKETRLRNSPTGKNVVLKPGMLIYISYLYLHTSPKFWGPTAGEFDPNRFINGVEKHQPFMAFGVGVRHCVGYKFALLAAKVYLITLLKAYDFIVIDKDCKAVLNNLLETSVKVRVSFTPREKVQLK